MAEMPEYTKNILKKYLPDDVNKKDAIWLHPQSGQWIITHKAVEIMCASAGVVFDNPEVHQADVGNGIFVISVTGHLPLTPDNSCAGGGTRAEWSFGEASKANCKMQYPAAMAEKRAKDRVALKLLGLHGFVYSDVEGAENEEQASQKPIKSSAELAQEYIERINGYTDAAKLEAAYIAATEAINALDAKDKALVVAAYKDKRASYEKKQSAE